MTPQTLLRVAGLGLAVSVVCAAPNSPGPLENIQVAGDLKPGKGREVVMAHCMLCHSAAVIVSSHRSREGWDETINRMQKQNGLSPLPPPLRSEILDYLAATQPPSDPGLEKSKETPWAAPLYRANPLW